MNSNPEDAAPGSAGAGLEAALHPLQEARRLRRTLLADMSHDVHTPLNVIIGFAELMSEGKGGPVSDEHKEYLGDILDSSRHLLRLIDDVLAFARVEAEKTEAGAEPLHLTAIMAEIHSAIQGLDASTRSHITIHVVREGPDRLHIEVEPGPSP